MKKKNKILISCLILGLTIYGLHYRYLKIYHGYTPTEFTVNEWKKATPEERGYMLESLQSKYKLEGMEREELYNLLSVSKKEITEYKNVLFNVGYMGFNKNAPMINYYSLYIKFENEQVTKVSVDD